MLPFLFAKITISYFPVNPVALRDLRDQAVKRLTVFSPCFFDDLCGKLGRRGLLVPVYGDEIIPEELFIVALLGPSLLLIDFWPEP